MSRLLVAVAGTFASTGGGVTLLRFLPWRLLRHPRLHGADYLLGVVREALNPSPLGAAGAGLGLVLVGVALGLKSSFPVPGEAHLGRGRLALLFWSPALAGTGAVFCLLLRITLLNLGLG